MTASEPLSTIRLTGAQALVRLLQAEGVPFAFGIASGKLAPLMQALSQQDSIRFVGLRHEASGPMMAAAVAQSGGRVCVALGEMGPGALNLAAGAGGAFNNRLPVLLVTTNQHRAAAYPARGMFMDIDTRALMAPVTRFSAVVADGRRLPELLHTALRHALGPRPGPVHLDIHQDVLAGPVDLPAALLDLPPAQHRATGRPRPDADALVQAAALLRGARRPLIVAGGGVVASDAAAQVLALAQRLQAPVVCTQMALGTVPGSSAHNIGPGGLIAGPGVRQAIAQADLVLSVGCRWSSWLWDEQGPMVRLQAGAQHVAINTDALALGEPALHSVALLADARATLDELLTALGATSATAEPGWLPACRAARVAHEDQLAALADEASPPPGAAMHPAALARAVAQALPADALVVFDGGHTSFWSNDFTPAPAPRTRFHEPGMCQLGFGLPHALALALRHPGRPVFNLTGDGSFGFTLQELDTARRLSLPVITVIHNNEAWGIIRAGQQALGQFELGTSLAGTDYAAIARGFGGHGETVHHPGEVADAIERALASGLPAVIDARCRFERHPCMPDFGAMNRFGFQPA